MNESLNPSARYRILFLGTPAFAIPGLDALIRHPRITVGAVLTQPDRPAGRGGTLTPSPVKHVALRHSIPVLQPERVRKELPAVLKELEGLGPFDIGVVIAFGQILPQPFLDFPRRGCVNVHASLLPRWRGAAPLHRALMAGDSETGVCLMQMDAGLDTGGVFAERRCSIAAKETLGSLHDRVAQLGADLLYSSILSIIDGQLMPRAQPSAGVTYAHKLTNEETELIWTDTAESLERKIRALNPSPGAFTLVHGKRLKIFDAEVRPATDDLPVGTLVVQSTLKGEPPQECSVRCGSGSLFLQQVQLEGKKRMGIAELLRGTSLPNRVILPHSRGPAQGAVLG